MQDNQQSSRQPHRTFASDNPASERPDGVDSFSVEVVDGQLLASAEVGETSVAIAQPVDAEAPASALKYVAREAVMVARARSLVSEHEPADATALDLEDDRAGAAGGPASTPGYGAARGGESGGD